MINKQNRENMTYKEEQTIRNQYANEDLTIAEEESTMAIAQTMLGTIWVEVESGNYKMTGNNGEVLFSGTDRNKALSFIAQSYQVC